MASIRCRKETGTLLLDFMYRGTRCREQTMLADTPAHRARLEALVTRIERAMAQGAFRYGDYFPDSPRAREEAVVAEKHAELPIAKQGSTPSFAQFAEVWFEESLPRWRKRYREDVRVTLDQRFLPRFGKKALHEIDRADLLAFRAEIAKRPGRKGQTLSAKRINKLMMMLKAILNDGCDRYGINSPARGIKALKQKRAEIHPFSLAEVDRLITTVRADYRAYLTVRCLTGLRTGEANGLQWGDIDFARGTIRVERSYSRGGDDELKTELSKREIPMVGQVRAAMEAQRTQVIDGCPWVFHSNSGLPVDEVNFTNRVWYPLLRHLGLAHRPPYQMRHTAATLMLAAGENPEWVAKILGHSTTEMLFRVYSRYIPNLTRQDGRAFAGLINTHSSLAPANAPAQDIDTMDADALRRELKAVMSAQTRSTPAVANEHMQR